MTDWRKKRLVDRAIDSACALFFFTVTSAVVWWQNTRLTVLYDLAGVLEPAARIAQGDIPYRDFPFPYAPLTFVTQAALIRFGGAVYWHHIVYACVVAGLASVVCWRIVTNILTNDFPARRFAAFVISLPLAVLGVYCIFPHPFYDPDTAFVILLTIWLLQVAERNGFPSILTIFVGAATVVPFFFKQNIGIAYLCGIAVWLAVGTVADYVRKRPVRQYFYVLLGIFLGFAIAAVLIYETCGIENYKYWTWDFATARRTPQLGEMLAIYANPALPIWVVTFLGGTYLAVSLRFEKLIARIVGVVLMSAPFIWPTIYLLFDEDASERAERLVNLWPFVFIVMALLTYVFLRRVNGFAYALPLVLIATAHGTFLSQQLWGSTYGIWPFFTIMIALLVTQINNRERSHPTFVAYAFSFAVTISLFVAGGFYVYSNERLDYVDFNDGEMQHSMLPQLAGMSMRGDYLPGFDELVRYTEANIPGDDGVLYLPGEDLFFYATGRHPHFPVELFDVTNNPYNAVEIRDRVIASDIEWVIVKDDTEIESDDMIDSKDAIFNLLKPSFRNIESLDNYEIYKRRHADDPPDEDDDSDGSDDGGEN